MSRNDALVGHALAGWVICATTIGVGRQVLPRSLSAVTRCSRVPSAPGFLLFPYGCQASLSAMRADNGKRGIDRNRDARDRMADRPQDDSQEVARLVRRRLPPGAWKYPSPRTELRSAENYNLLETCRALGEGGHPRHLRQPVIAELYIRVSRARTKAGPRVSAPGGHAGGASADYRRHDGSVA